MSSIEKFKGKRDNFIFNTFIYFEPVKRFKNRSGMTKFRSSVGVVVATEQTRTEGFT